MSKSSARLVTVDSKIMGRVLGRPHLARCKKCKELFKVGDEIITKKGKTVSRWYHCECASALNIWWPEQ